MKIGDITKKIRHCSDGTITIHIYDQGSGCSEDLVMTMREMFERQDKTEYPFGATLASIDYIRGRLVINGYLRA